jgi:hypothetical protein
VGNNCSDSIVSNKESKLIDDKQKIEVAKSFAKEHPEAFAIWAQGRSHSSDDHYLTVFDDLIVGVYGECYGVNAVFDSNGNQIQVATKYEVSVDQLNSLDGRTEMFYFEVKLGQVSGDRLIDEYESNGI